MEIRRSAVALILTGCVLGTAAVAAWRQQSNSPAHPHAQWESRYRPANLRLLSKDLSGSEMKRVMDGYVQEVGVPCEFCHVQDDRTGAFDFASDDSPAKETARLMISMLKDINEKYLAQLGEGSYAAPITCGNCHQGRKTPPEFHALRPAGTATGSGS